MKSSMGLKNSHHTHIKATMWGKVTDVLTNLTEVIILHYTQISNHHVVHPKLHIVICQFCFCKGGAKKEKRCGHFWEEWDGEKKTKCIILWQRNVKNSLVYYVKKKMAHLLLHKCYIHIVFSVTVTEKFWTSCCWLKRFINNTLNLTQDTNLQ